MIARTAAVLLPVALATALSGCSMLTTVQARFIDARVAFVGVERELGCIYSIEVREQATGNLVWQLEDEFSNRKCLGDDPHFYGKAHRQARTVVVPAKLRLGMAYEVNGTAEGSNYFGGAFRITRDTLYRIEDLPLKPLGLTG